MTICGIGYHLVENEEGEVSYGMTPALHEFKAGTIIFYSLSCLSPLDGDEVEPEDC